MCNGNLFSWSRLFPANICQLWINLFHQISLPDNSVHHVSINFLTWKTHLVNPPSKYHLLFSRKPSHSGTTEVLYSIPFIWEYEHTEKLENNQWKCLWCDIKFQGINATKYLAHVIGTKCMHINICRASIDQDYLSRYKQLQKIKAAKKGLLNDYSQKMISSISRLQDKSSEVVESNIRCNSRGM